MLIVGIERADIRIERHDAALRRELLEQFSIARSTWLQREGNSAEVGNLGVGKRGLNQPICRALLVEGIGRRTIIADAGHCQSGGLWTALDHRRVHAFLLQPFHQRVTETVGGKARLEADLAAQTRRRDGHIERPASQGRREVLQATWGDGDEVDESFATHMDLHEFHSIGVMNYRPNFHIAPPLGRLNDPNGVFLDGDTLHVYYQHDPCFPYASKRTGWGHASALLSAPGPWQHHPDVLYPDMPYDMHGCYSGGAVVDGTDVWLYYTGNLKRDGRRIPSQNRVRVLDPSGPEGGIYQRDAGNPLIPDAEEGFTGHFRDPQISRDEHGWRMVIGAQRTDETGTVVLYRSTDLEVWEFQGELNFALSDARPGLSPDILPGGYMWECPNLVTLTDKETGKDKDVLVFCPQGLEPVSVDGQTHYASSDQCGYVVGRLEGTTFHVERGFSELDYGHEFYAPQLVGTGDGEAVMLGWIGLPSQDDKPTVDEGWVHTLSLPRRVWLEDGWLHQLPVWKSIPEASGREGFGTTTSVVASRGGQYSLVDAAGTERLQFTAGDGLLRVKVGEDERVIACPEGELVAIADGCAVEIFAGGGHVAAAASVFGENDARWSGWREI